MKVGILTLPFNNNYGGYLQAYALMTVLKKMGHDVELIFRRHNKRGKITFVAQLLKNIVKKILGRKVLFVIPDSEKIYEYRGKNMLPFSQKYIEPKTEPFFNSQKMNHHIKKKYDAVVVGSDQVWRPDYVPNVVDYFFHDIHRNGIKKIAYAASFGNGNPFFSDEEWEKCCAAISNFDSVGLRERTGLKVIKEMGWNGEAELVLDPTLLLSKDEYEKILQGKSSIAKGKLFLYVLDELTNDVVQSISITTHLEPYYIMNLEQWKCDDYQMPAVEDWLNGIRNSSMVVTDSFHGMVFSIIFNKPFWVVANENRGKDRFESLLSQVGLENRIVDAEKICECDWNAPIDWQNVNEKILTLKNDSFSFLRGALE